MQKYVDLCEVIEVEVGGQSYREGAATVKAYIVRSKDRKEKNNACLVNFHGGAAIAGTAEQCNPLCARYAIECDVTIINVDYRLDIHPAGQNDGYAAVKWVLEYCSMYGIDRSRIAVMGESGGAYIAAGVAMRLAKDNEGHLVQFVAQLIPMTSNDFLVKKPEHIHTEMLKGKYDQLLGRRIE